MGVIYYAICRDCRVYQDLDKFYLLHEKVRDRSEAFKLAKRICEPLGDSFRSALLVSFMGEHIGHNCSIVSDQDETEEHRQRGWQQHPSNPWKVRYANGDEDEVRD